VVVTAPDGRTLWEVRAAGEQLRVRTVTDPGMAPQRQCRLWLRWEEAGHYQPVAVLAEEPGRHRMPMPEGLRGRLGDSQVLVSVTPSGQAAGERPQGRVIFRGSWARL
jgi:anti-sigma-K factor RskA